MINYMYRRAMQLSANAPIHLMMQRLFVSSRKSFMLAASKQNLSEHDEPPFPLAKESNEK